MDEYGTSVTPLPIMTETNLKYKYCLLRINKINLQTDNKHKNRVSIGPLSHSAAHKHKYTMKAIVYQCFKYLEFHNHTVIT